MEVTAPEKVMVMATAKGMAVVAVVAVDAGWVAGQAMRLK